MSDGLQPPSSYYFGQDLNWDSESENVTIFLELPFWLMIPNCTQNVRVNDSDFEIDIVDNYIELYAMRVYNSKRSCIYLGPPANDGLPSEVQKIVDDRLIPLLAKQCKTVLKVHSSCNKSVLDLYSDDGRRSAYMYLRAFCEAHLEIVNKLIKTYRVKTYDYFAYEVSPWDVPVWFINSNSGFSAIRLFDYIEWDEKPMLKERNGDEFVYNLVNPEDISAGLNTDVDNSEMELLDSMNFMERGDYSDAVRRVTTAIEAKLETVLEAELRKKFSISEVKEKLNASKNDFPGRLRQYQKLSGRIMDDGLLNELERTRSLRHEIVHKGLRVNFEDRGNAQRSIDTGRWIFDWLENRPQLAAIRDSNIGMRSLGRHLNFFSAGINGSGVVVFKPRTEL